jgi:hypothetical protein
MVVVDAMIVARAATVETVAPAAMREEATAAHVVNGRAATTKVRRQSSLPRSSRVTTNKP